MSKRLPGPSPEDRPEDDLDRMLGVLSRDDVATRTFEDAEAREVLLRDFTRVRGATSQKDIATRMRTTQSAVSDIENNRVDPRLSTLQRMARALGCLLNVELVGPGSEIAGGGRGAAAVGAAYTTAKVLTSLVRDDEEIGPQSPAELAGRVGLPEVAVGRTVSRLAIDGWVDPVDTFGDEPRFALRGERGLAIGVSVSRSSIEMVLTDLHTEILHHLSREITPDLAAPDDVIDAVSALADEIQGSLDRFGRSAVVGLGVSFAGLIDDERGSVIFATDLYERSDRWRHVPMKGALEDRVSLPTVVENDANALALHEFLRHREDQVLVSVLLSSSGEGVGSGLVVNGVLAHGVGGVSGELGHFQVDPNGPPCRCSESARGCLETFVSPNAIARAVQASSDAAVRNVADAAALAEKGDEIAVREFRRAGALLGHELARIALMLGPPRIFLYGPREMADDAFASARAFLAECRDALEGVPFKNRRVDLAARTLDDTTLAAAAASTAVRSFLSAPSRSISYLKEELEELTMASSS